MDALWTVQAILAVLALLGSSYVLANLAPSKPFCAASLRVRSSLVLSITVVDVLYALIHVAAAIIAQLDLDSSKFCWVLGPVLYFAIFSVYITIANLAHYSFYRLTRRTSDRMRLLRWYTCVWICGSSFLTIVMMTGLYASGSKFELTAGYCHADQHVLLAQVTCVTTQISCLLFIVLMVAWLNRSARHAHSNLVLMRQQGVVTGYLAVSLVIGVIQVVKMGVYYISDGDGGWLITAYMILNLLWPTANFLVFVVVSRRALTLEKKAVGFNSTEPETGQPLVMEDKDSAAWREVCKTTITSRRQSLAVQLQPAISDLLPAGHHAMARQFARRIVKESGSMVAGVLLADPAQLRKAVVRLWRERNGPLAMLPALLCHSDDVAERDEFSSASDEESGGERVDRSDDNFSSEEESVERSKSDVDSDDPDIVEGLGYDPPILQGLKT